MKKNFLTKLLMMVSFVAILGGVGSCKDYSEERYSDLLGKLNDQNTTLTDAMEAQKQELEGKISDLQALLDACKKECQGKIAALEAALQDQSNKHDQDIARLSGEIVTLQGVVADLQKQIDDINKIIGDEAQLGGKTIVEYIVEINTTITQIQGTIESIENRLEAVELTTDDLKKRVEALETWRTEIDQLIVGWKERLSKVEQDAAKALADAAANTAAIENMKKLNDSINKAQDARLDSIVAALEDFATKAELEEVRKEALANYEAAKKYAKDQVDALRTELNGTISDLRADMEAADAALQDQLTALEKRVSALEEQVAKNTIAIHNLTGAFNKLITSLIIQGTDNPVTGSVATPFGTRSNILAAYYGVAPSAGLTFPTDLPRFYVDNSDIQLTYEDLAMLNVTPIKKNAGEMIIGEEGNAGTIYLTVNPNTVDFTGTKFSLVNSQDEVAAATLGAIESSDKVLNFGLTRAANNGFYEAKATISENDVKDVELDINFGELKAVAKDAINGDGFNVTQMVNTIQNTLNALSMDANGLKASWRDYQGEHSVYSQYGIAVTAIKPLSYSFGKDFNYTKAPGVDRIENFIGKVTDKLFNKVTGVLPNFENLNFTAPEIKQIEIAALNPDSFKIDILIEDTVEYDLNLDVPVDDVVINSVNGQTQSITVTVPKQTHHVYNESTGIYEDITIPEYTIDVPASNFTVDGQIVHINNVKVNKKLEIPVSITYTHDLYPIINDLYGNITGSIEDVNDMLAELDAFMDDVNKMLDELNKLKDLSASINNAKDEIKEELTKYLNKFNNKFCDLINSTNKVLRPVLLVNTNKGFQKLSQAKSNPTVITGNELQLIPTSYSLEYLAPAYKKLVGVTNVYKDGASAQGGNADCKAALEAVNGQENLAEILAGDTYLVDANFQAGYVYEIVYTAVDFHGMVDAKKFYLTVK